MPNEGRNLSFWLLYMLLCTLDVLWFVNESEPWVKVFAGFTMTLLIGWGVYSILNGGKRE